MIEQSFVADELLGIAPLRGEIIPELLKESKNKIILELLKTCEQGYFDKGYDPDVLKHAVDNLAEQIHEIMNIIEQLEESEEYSWASKLALLTYLVGDEANLPVQNFWGKVVNIVRVSGRCYLGTDFFYVIMANLLQNEIELIRSGQLSIVKVVSFTPLLFLPSEKHSLARACAYNKYGQYLSCSDKAILEYLFCDTSTRSALQNSTGDEVEQVIDVIKNELLNTWRKQLDLRYFIKGHGLRSCILGTHRGVIIEKAETHSKGFEEERILPVREIRGVLLKQEKTTFDECFNNPNETFKLTSDHLEYLDILRSNPETYLFARNKGVYSQEEQDKLKKATVAIIGLGCVGGLVAQTLTRIGVPKLILVDFDVFDLKNINRQPYAAFDTVGRLKTQVTEHELKRINPLARPIPYPKGLDATNAEEIIKQADVVVQCVDDIGTRILIHRVAKNVEKPVITMSGQPPYRGFVSTFFPDIDYEEIMGFRNETKDIPINQLNSKQAKELWRTFKLNRAKTAYENTPPVRKEILKEWYDEYSSKERDVGWSVTFERTWIMGILQAHEVIRYITGGEKNVLAKAPEAIIVDLARKDGNIVQVTEPTKLGQYAIAKHWNYQYF